MPRKPHELEFVRRYCDWGQREGSGRGGFGKSTGYGRQYQPGGVQGTWPDLAATAVAGGWKLASEERKGDVRVSKLQPVRARGCRDADDRRRRHGPERRGGYEVPDRNLPWRYG